MIFYFTVVSSGAVFQDAAFQLYSFQCRASQLHRTKLCHDRRKSCFVCLTSQVYLFICWKEHVCENAWGNGTEEPWQPFPASSAAMTSLFTLMLYALHGEYDFVQAYMLYILYTRYPFPAISQAVVNTLIRLTLQWKQNCCFVWPTSTRFAFK